MKLRTRYQLLRCCAAALLRCCAGQYSNQPNNWEPARHLAAVDELLIRIFFSTDENMLPHRTVSATNMYRWPLGVSMAAERGQLSLYITSKVHRQRFHFDTRGHRTGAHT